MNDIAGRVERLERENRCWRLGGAVSSLVVLIVVGSGAANFAPDSMNLKKLTIVDDQGETRLLLESNQHGASISGYTRDHKTSFVLETTADGGLPHLLLFDPKGNPRLGMMVREADPKGGVIEFIGETGKRTHTLP